MDDTPSLGTVVVLQQPRHIVCNTPQHHFLLSTGQHSDADHKGEQSKYSKLAYSSSFGLSVSLAGRSLKALAPDSTLSLSLNGGKSWKVLWEPYDLQAPSVQVGDEVVPTLRSTYKPFKHLDMEVTTTLVPPVRKYPGWHFRVHKIRCGLSCITSAALKQLQCVDSGFSASGITSKGLHISETPCQEDKDATLASEVEARSEGWWHSTESALIYSESGLSGVTDLSKPGESGSPIVETRGEAFKPHANTNIMIQRSLIPCVHRTINFSGLAATASDGSVVSSFITGVFAVENAAGASPAETLAMWRGLSRDDLRQLNV